MTSPIDNLIQNFSAPNSNQYNTIQYTITRQTKLESRMTNIKVDAQHKHATRRQQAALEALIEESRSRVPEGEPPISYVRARSITSGPMGPALAAINLTALQYSGFEKEHTLLAFYSALVKIETEIQFADESRDLVRDDEIQLVEEEVPNSMCSKIPFVEMMFEEAQRVDRGSLRVFLGYIVDVVKGFDEELERKDREVQRIIGEAEKGDREGLSGKAKVPIFRRETR
ncbi:hypothetical protein BKA65DRAFT_476635 [Rhexocercosporidium sp. MPI-PUGE-AT-0058]|nr:hypothetical protein BKA65DRAFT_476635 [Rhexocercosporidium sp. MPI-PUGE-AT-0058]